MQSQRPIAVGEVEQRSAYRDHHAQRGKRDDSLQPWSAACEQRQRGADHGDQHRQRRQHHRHAHREPSNPGSASSSSGASVSFALSGSGRSSSSGTPSRSASWETLVSSGSLLTSSAVFNRYDRYVSASTNAAMPMLMTIAVRIMPCANGSAVVASPLLVRPRIGGLPDGLPTVRISRLIALPISNSPSNIRVRLRSSSRYTPAEVSPPMSKSGTSKVVMRPSSVVVHRVPRRPVRRGYAAHRAPGRRRSGTRRGRRTTQ